MRSSRSLLRWGRAEAVVVGTDDLFGTLEMRDVCIAEDEAGCER